MRLSPGMITPVILAPSLAFAHGDPANDIPIGEAIADGHVHVAGTLDMPVEQQRRHTLDSGVTANLGTTAAVVFQDLVHQADAHWLRVYFDEASVELGPGSYIRVSSLADGEVQDLDAGTLALWGYASAYFNGDTVKIELIAAPGTEANRVVITNVGVDRPIPQPVGGNGECGICGNDDRVPSSDEWTGRLFPAGCTASVYNELSCLVSAGHCVGGNMVVQFNVPNSLSNCAPVSPPIADQFPAFLGEFNNNGTGDDWAVMTAGTNNIGQTPFERYGVLKEIYTGGNPAGTLTRLTGYGVDNTCIRSQTQQTHTGTICQVFSNAYTFAVDLRGGNSGSSLLREANQGIIGIATHCPCCNVATRITNPDFVAARQNVCGVPTTTLPFFDDFPDFDLDPELWPVVSGAHGSNRGINEPSPERSLNCDATTTGGDQAQTAAMNATSVNDLRVTYWYQQTGFDDPPEDGEDLVVEYANSAGTWIEVNRHLGSGPSMTEYDPYVIEMPSAAQHSEFRLRFRSISFDAASDNDDHFVDDVCIGSEAQCPDPGPPCPWDCGEINGTVDTVDFLSLLSQWGGPGSCDFNGDMIVDTLDFLELLANWGDCP